MLLLVFVFCVYFQAINSQAISYQFVLKTNNYDEILNGNIPNENLIKFRKLFNLINLVLNMKKNQLKQIEINTPEIANNNEFNVTDEPETGANQMMAKRFFTKNNYNLQQ